MSAAENLRFTLAPVAVCLGVPLLHRDRDFDVLAAHTPLSVLPVGG